MVSTFQLPTTNPPVLICAWCPDFDPMAPINRNATHGICPSCDATLNAEMDARPWSVLAHDPRD